MKYILLITFTLLTSCSSTYWNDRRMDLTDSIHLTSEALGVGINANVSALCVGASNVSSIWGEPKRGKLGLGGTQSTKVVTKTIMLMSLPIQENPPRSRWDYGGKIPPFASAGISAGFWVNFGARVDLLEIVDFIGGIFMIDIMDDDLKVETTDNELTSKHQDWFQSHFKSIKILGDKVELTPDYSKSYLNKVKDPKITLHLNKPYKINNSLFTLIKNDALSAKIQYESKIEIRKNHIQMDSGTVTLNNK